MAMVSPLPPGFRFHPTDEELILHYLRNRTASPFCPASIIADVDIYKFNPWDLPEKANFGEREWYFFSPRDRKYPNGVRPNRAAASGYWKATGTDKRITTSKGSESIGVKKTLVFYKGKPSMGVKTNWIMHEFRLLDSRAKRIAVKNRDNHMRLDDWVLCRIYQKTSQPPSAGNKVQEVASVEENMVRNSSFSFTELLIVDESDISLLPILLEAPLMTTISERTTVPSTASVTSRPIEPEGNRPKRQSLTANCWFDEWSGFYPSSSTKQMNTSSCINDQPVNPFDLSQPFFYRQSLLNFPSEMSYI